MTGGGNADRDAPPYSGPTFLSLSSLLTSSCDSLTRQAPDWFTTIHQLLHQLRRPSARAHRPPALAGLEGEAPAGQAGRCRQAGDLGGRLAPAQVGPGPGSQGSNCMYEQGIAVGPHGPAHEMGATCGAGMGTKTAICVGEFQWRMWYSVVVGR
jgi:hypothetical protein